MVYCSGKGRLPLQKAAEETGWSISSAWRILREARELVGTENVPSAPEQRGQEIRRIYATIVARRGKGTQDGERAALAAGLVGCSTKTAYRHLAQSA